MKTVKRNDNGEITHVLVGNEFVPKEKEAFYRIQKEVEDMKIIRIKKSFRKYEQFWYNGMAGQIFFATELNKDEWKVHDFNCTQLGIIPHKTHSGYMVLKHHAEVVGEL